MSEEEAVNSSLGIEDEAVEAANLYQVPPSIVLLLSIFYGLCVCLKVTH